MSSKRKSNYAFPFPMPHDPDPGMELRDYFAAKAMQAAIIAAGSWGPCVFSDFDVDAVATFAHRQADAMLEERAKS